MRLKSFFVTAVSAGLLSLPATVLVSPTLPAASQFSREEQVNIDVYQTASPAVVTLRTGRSSGSGSIISPEGLVITNDHVVRGASGGVVSVRLADGRQFQGRVIANDRRNDLALVRLQTNGERLPTLRLANPDQLRVGQRVFAIGSPLGMSGTLTTGTLSRIGRNGNLNMDLNLNPGNSGGPLLNSRGELIGVNKAIIVGPDGNKTGIAVATSGTIVQDFVASNRDRTSPSGPIASDPPSRPDRVASGNNTTDSRIRINPGGSDSIPDSPRLGVVLNTSTFIVQQVQPGSPASRVGIRPGDRVLAVNGQRLRSMEQLMETLDRRPNAVVLTVVRDQRAANVRVSF